MLPPLASLILGYGFGGRLTPGEADLLRPYLALLDTLFCYCESWGGSYARYQCPQNRHKSRYLMDSEQKLVRAALDGHFSQPPVLSCIPTSSDAENLASRIVLTKTQIRIVIDDLHLAPTGGSWRPKDRQDDQSNGPARPKSGCVLVNYGLNNTVPSNSGCDLQMSLSHWFLTEAEQAAIYQNDCTFETYPSCTACMEPFPAGFSTSPLPTHQTALNEQVVIHSESNFRLPSGR